MLLSKVKLFFLALILLMPRISDAQVSTSVSLSKTGNIWSYTVKNLEPVTSSLYIASFNLAVNAPIISVSSPIGWDYSTDLLTYVFWFNTDTALPYLNDIAPGLLLGGFDISSNAVESEILQYDIAAWDHNVDNLGPGSSGLISAPSVAPEPSSFVLIFLGGVTCLLIFMRYRI